MGIAAVWILVLAGCGPAAIGPPPVDATVIASTPTVTPAPTVTPTLVPTATPIPTATPEPTATFTPSPEPTATPVPSPTATPDLAGLLGVVPTLADLPPDVEVWRVAVDDELIPFADVLAETYTAIEIEAYEAAGRFEFLVVHTLYVADQEAFDAQLNPGRLAAVAAPVAYIVQEGDPAPVTPQAPETEFDLAVDSLGAYTQRFDVVGTESVQLLVAFRVGQLGVVFNVV
ncbi:MAG: hypothetical protein ACFB51_18725 [Anaerolineae bacterium]